MCMYNRFSLTIVKPFFSFLTQQDKFYLKQKAKKSNLSTLLAFSISQMTADQWSVTINSEKTLRVVFDQESSDD